LLLLREEGTAKDLGILAAETECFKRQCDCFVTKRLTVQWFALKGVTNQLRVQTLFMGRTRRIRIESRSIWKSPEWFHTKAQR
jgi:hypothetical protein